MCEASCFMRGEIFMDENNLQGIKKSKFKFIFFLILGLCVLIFFIFKFKGCLYGDTESSNTQEDMKNEIVLNSGEAIDGEVADPDYENVPEFEGSIQGRLDNDDTPKELKNIAGTKMIGDVEFSNIIIGKISDDKCVVTADVKNLSKDFSESEKLSIKVIDEKGEVKESFGGILTELAGLEPNKFKTYVLSDITYASDLILEVVKNE